MTSLIPLIALAVASGAAPASSTAGPAAAEQLATAIETLDDRLEVQTLTKMHAVVEREIVELMDALLERVARRVVASIGS